MRHLLLFIVFILPASLTQAIEYEEGKHYVEIKGNLTAQKEVTEYFSFFCPACFRQEPFMKDLKATLPEDAVFRKNHVDGMPSRDKDVEHSLTKALITANHFGVNELVIPAIFDAIHLNKKGFKQDNEIRDIFVSSGVDGNRFDKAFASFSVNSQAKKMQKNTASIRSQGYSGVPTLIVNGKYKPVTDHLKSMDEYKALILFLLDKR